MDIAQLKNFCDANDLSLCDEQFALLARYAELLATWNSKINLISRKDAANIFERHILHSLTLAMPTTCEYDFRNKRVIDIGTGGGLPGIPMKIAIPSLDIMLVDSIQKKIAAVRDMISQLKLTGAQAIAARAEELATSHATQPEHAHRYDAVVTRAVAPLEDLVTWSSGLLKPGGTLLALKGGDLTEETERAKRLKQVASIETRTLDLIGYPDFANDGKQIVRVQFLL